MWMYISMREIISVRRGIAIRERSANSSVSFLLVKATLVEYALVWSRLVYFRNLRK